MLFNLAKQFEYIKLGFETAAYVALSQGYSIQVGIPQCPRLGLEIYATQPLPKINIDEYIFDKH